MKGHPCQPARECSREIVRLESAWRQTEHARHLRQKQKSAVPAAGQTLVQANIPRKVRSRLALTISCACQILRYCIETSLLLPNPPLGLRRAWRKLLKHFLHALIQILDVLVGIVGEGVARNASPNELFRFRVEEIDDQRAYLICFGRGGCLSKTSPPPASSKAVVKGIQGLLIAGDLDSYD